MQRGSRWSLVPLFMVILLDVAGIILVMPVLTPLLLQPGSGMLSAGTSVLCRDFFYGLSLALFPLFMFFSTPVLGDLSDRYGRKTILLACLLLSALSYGVAALGVVMKSLFVLLFSRVIAGLAAGTQPIATAAIIDTCAPSEKSARLAFVVFAASLGLILGPALAGFTADPSIASWFGYDTPFWIAAGVCFLNALMLIFFLKESRAPAARDRVLSLTKGFTLFLGAFREKRFRWLSLLYFCYVLAWSFYYQSINWVFMERYQYSVGSLGAFVAFIGVVFAISTSLTRTVLRFLTHETVIFAVFVFGMSIANFAAAITQSELAQWLWAILNATGDVFCYTMSLAIFSSLAGDEAQGWIMGVAGAIGAMTWAVGGLVIGPLGFLHLTLPLWLAGFLCLASFVLMVVYIRQPRTA